MWAKNAGEQVLQHLKPVRAFCARNFSQVAAPLHHFTVFHYCHCAGSGFFNSYSGPEHLLVLLNKHLHNLQPFGYSFVQG